MDASRSKNIKIIFDDIDTYDREEILRMIYELKKTKNRIKRKILFK